MTRAPARPALWIVLALLLGSATTTGCSDQGAQPLAATTGGEAIARQLVAAWASFAANLREGLGLPPGSQEERKAAALESLIRAQWVRQESAIRHISLTPVERRAAVLDFEHRLSLLPPEARELRRMAGLDKRSFEARAVAAALLEKMVERMPMSTLAPAALRRYYRTHARELGEPEMRTVNFVLTTSEGEATRAKRALESGDDWRLTAAHYSHPQALSEFGWQVPEATRSAIRELVDDGLSNVAFSAQPYQVLGPRPLENGWVVFEVTEVEPAFRPPFRLARQAVRNRLLEQREHLALSSLRQRLQNKYADQARCADDFQIRWCQPLPRSDN